ncbi:helix-turn-helix domain-containing protein [Streptomyces mirabilis]|uniref:helix-turn-helix domain-containing protein n=1 Tax=Streptomyces mirabilis TaxID=68239 RepID=UPI003CCF87F2
MQLRYAFRLDPGSGQRVALARALGCARVVYNDAVAARERARREGAAFPSAGVLSKTLITEAKRSPGRQWLSEVSAVILQQALRDVERAYSNFFASVKGVRKGARVGAPRFRSKRDARQAIRFTAKDHRGGAAASPPSCPPCCPWPWACCTASTWAPPG